MLEGGLEGCRRDGGGLEGCRRDDGGLLYIIIRNSELSFKLTGLLVKSTLYTKILVLRTTVTSNRPSLIGSTAKCSGQTKESPPNSRL